MNLKKRMKFLDKIKLDFVKIVMKIFQNLKHFKNIKFKKNIRRLLNFIRNVYLSYYKKDVKHSKTVINAIL